MIIFLYILNNIQENIKHTIVNPFPSFQYTLLQSIAVAFSLNKAKKGIISIVFIYILYYIYSIIFLEIPKYILKKIVF